MRVPDVCVLVFLQSSLENEVSRAEGDLDNFVSLTQEILLRFLREHFPIQDPWSITTKDMLLEFASKMELPNR